MLHGFFAVAFSYATAIFYKILEEVMENRNENLKKLVVSAVMIAIGTVLSLDAFKFGGLWLFGGGVPFVQCFRLLWCLTYTDAAGAFLPHLHTA